MIKENMRIALKSNKEVLLFNKSQDNKLFYDMYDSKLNFLEHKILSNKGIIFYDIYIDKNDTLHLVLLEEFGNLLYYKLIDNKWSSGVIGRFDLQSNIYKQIEILFISDKLHIIYNFSNLINSNVWTIQHIIYSDKTEEANIISRYISTKNPKYFLIDVDSKGTIHLLYNTNMKKFEIFHSFYNPYTNYWSSKTNKISEKDSINLFPYIFIDTKDNVHVIWLKSNINKYTIEYLKMNANGKKKYIWRHIKLSDINISKYPAIIFEEDSKLKLLYVYNNSVKLIKSTDYGDSWSIEENSYPINNNTIFTKIRSNIFSKTSKSNHLYCQIKDKPKFYFSEIFRDIFDPINKNTKIEKTEEKDETIIVEDQDFNLNSTIYNNLNKKLNNILNNQNYIKEHILKILEYEQSINIKLDKRSFLEKIFNSPK